MYKRQAICREAVPQRVTSFAGVPSWNLVLMNRVLEYTGKQNILEVWPEMELFVHGGMNFNPYREQYRRIFPSDTMKYMETYNACLLYTSPQGGALFVADQTFPG